VDTVLEVLYIEEKDISQPPRFNNDSQNKYIEGIGQSEEKVIILLDCTKLLSIDEVNELGLLEQ